MIFPRECKEVGYARGSPCGDRVYFLTRYQIRPVDGGFEVAEVTTERGEKGLMRTVRSSRTLARAAEVTWYSEPVQLHDRKQLVDLAAASGFRCTIFTGLDEHLTFVLDPDPGSFLTIHVYDIEPPRPSLSHAIHELEACGLFGDLDVGFAHQVHDIRTLDAEIYPCRAAGFDRTLDADPVRGGERVAGCLTGQQLIEECYRADVKIKDICPLSSVTQEPFITRCCRKEREGIGIYNGHFGAVVHWAAPPWRVAHLLNNLVSAWREYDTNSRG